MKVDEPINKIQDKVNGPCKTLIKNSEFIYLIRNITLKLSCIRFRVTLNSAKIRNANKMKRNVLFRQKLSISNFIEQFKTFETLNSFLNINI